MIALNREKVAEILARAGFFIYLFVIFFGTSLPFRHRVTEIEEISTSNLVTQFIFIALFLLSLFNCFYKRDSLIRLLKSEKFLTLFLLWCLLSISWSNYSFTSFKRLFQIITSVTVCLAFLLQSDSVERAVNYLKIILYLYVPVTVVSIIFIPGAIDPVHGTWRGLTVGKNYLGQASLVSVIVWCYLFKEGFRFQKVIYGIMIAISIALLFGSFSMTAIVTFSALLLLALLFSLDRLFRPLQIGRVFSLTFIVSSLALLFLFYFMGNETFISLFSSLGRDTTFTGRTDLWRDLFLLTKEHFAGGYGFGGFWVVDPNNIELMELYEQYIWLPNEAHSGYLDIFISTGALGVLIFTFMVLHYFLNLYNFNRPVFGAWLLTACLIMNLQESTLFFPKVLSGELFIFSYLVLFRERIAEHGRKLARHHY